MTAPTLLASADEPQPQPIQDPPPVTGSPWHPRYAQHRRGTNPIPRQRNAEPEMTGPNVFTIAICSSCGYPPGDGCDCPTFAGPAVAHLLAPWAGAW